MALKKVCTCALRPISASKAWFFVFFYSEITPTSIIKSAKKMQLIFEVEEAPRAFHIDHTNEILRF